jgi:hypothetical protein
MSVTASSAQTSMAPEVGASIRVAQEALEQEARRAEAVHDPTAPMLRALSQTIAAMHRTLVDSTLTIAKQIEDSRQPISEDALWRAVVQGVSAHARDITRGLNLRTALGAAGTVLVLMIASAVGGAVGGWWFFEEQNATTLSWGRAALSQCETVATGAVCHPSIKIGQAPSLQ